MFKRLMVGLLGLMLAGVAGNVSADIVPATDPITPSKQREFYSPKVRQPIGPSHGSETVQSWDAPAPDANRSVSQKSLKPAQKLNRYSEKYVISYR